MILPNSVQVKVIENTNDFFSKKDPVMRSISSCKIRIKSTNSLGNDKHCTLRALSTISNSPMQINESTQNNFSLQCTPPVERCRSAENCIQKAHFPSNPIFHIEVFPTQLVEIKQPLSARHLSKSKFYNSKETTPSISKLKLSDGQLLSELSKPRIRKCDQIAIYSQKKPSVIPPLDKNRIYGSNNSTASLNKFPQLKPLNHMRFGRSISNARFTQYDTTRVSKHIIFK